MVSTVGRCPFLSIHRKPKQLSKKCFTGMEKKKNHALIVIADLYILETEILSYLGPLMLESRYTNTSLIESQTLYGGHPTYTVSSQTHRVILLLIPLYVFCNFLFRAPLVLGL